VQLGLGKILARAVALHDLRRPQLGGLPVVKRFSQAAQRRRRRIASPASLTRESITWVSREPQKGHFMVGGRDSGVGGQGVLCGEAALE